MEGCFSSAFARTEGTSRIKILKPETSKWGRLALALLGAAWVVLHVALFHGWIAAAFLGLVPFAIGVAGASRDWQAVQFGLWFGWAMFLCSEYFLGLFSVPGLMILAFWQATTLVLVVLAIRWLHIGFRMPLAWALPVAWVGSAFLRNIGPFSFPGGMLSTPCHDISWMIQMCDLAGMYGMDFALGMVNGVIADGLLAIVRTGNVRWTERLNPVRSGFRPVTRWALASTVVVWGLIPFYGTYRLREAQSAVRVGPTISIVQPDVPIGDGVLEGFDPDLYLDDMIVLSNRALSNSPPTSLVVWPEAMSPMPSINEELIEATGVLPEPWSTRRAEGRSVQDRIRKWIDTGSRPTPLLLGTHAWIPQGTNRSDWLHYNAAVMVENDRSVPRRRQFKCKLFPGGEQIPFKGTWLHSMLTRLVIGSGSSGPFEGYEPGEHRMVFQLAPGHHRFIVNLCYEILFAETSGVFLDSSTAGKPFDFLVNVSNDGIFRRSHGLMVHWWSLQFRAVEARVGIARAANTGISGFVKPTGEVYGEVKNDQGKIWSGLGAPELPLIADVVRRRQREEDMMRNSAQYERLTNDIERIQRMRKQAGVSGQSTQPIYIDSRRTLYSRSNDFFAKTLFVLLCLAALCGLVNRPWRSAN